MSDLDFGRLLPAPLSVRRGVPFYYQKSEAEIAGDVYERYDALVTRQTALHLADELHGGYPFATLLEYVSTWLPVSKQPLAVADLGCSVGRIAATLAQRYADWDVYGLDLSYQMLRQARDFWTQGVNLQPNLIRFGWGTPALDGYQLENLHFGLSRAEALPFPDASLDVIINTFLIDRLPGPFSAFAEWRRVLKPGGRLITVSPLNFLQPDSWRKAYPPVKILDHLRQAGWRLDDWTDHLPLAEPMDARGNAVNWQCLAFVVER
ncbi:class I SAM-dependent methyltransferase [Neolewinella persica]|uniref:class I SAM-dependent methyltransferase n=1 Tax=Neolewinella persica TaxID=70998 RepID=UPI00037F22E7|nr:methyltransferase domain-containing protein [Neolewinella persica]